MFNKLLHVNKFVIFCHQGRPFIFDGHLCLLYWQHKQLLLLRQLRYLGLQLVLVFGHLLQLDFVVVQCAFELKFLLN